MWGSPATRFGLRVRDGTNTLQIYASGIVDRLVLEMFFDLIIFFGIENLSVFND